MNSELPACRTSEGVFAVHRDQRATNVSFQNAEEERRQREENEVQMERKKRST
jgi:hypothetical protein